MRMYFIAMSIRVLCVVSLFWVRGWWIILVAAGAILLPYFAVLVANAVSHTGGQAPEAPTPLELLPGAADPGAARTSDAFGAPAGEAGTDETVIVVDAPAERRSSARGDAGAAPPSASSTGEGAA